MCEHPSVIVRPYYMAWAAVCTECGKIECRGSRMYCEAAAEELWPGQWTAWGAVL